MPAADGPRLQAPSLIASFCKVSPGAECEIFKVVSPQHPYSYFYKALGSFDIVAIGEGSLSAPGPSIDHPELSSCQSLTAAKWSDQNYSAPEIPTWIAKAPLLGLVSLELDKWLYTSQEPSSSISSVIQYFLTHSKLDRDSLAFFAGFGQSELFVLIRTDTFDQIFNFVQVARSAKYRDINTNADSDDADYAVFSSTHTIPLISYKEVLIDKNFKKIHGMVKGSIEVSCPPGFESVIGTDKSFGTQQSYSHLGQTDIVILLDNINASLLIEKLLEFRSKWVNMSPLLVDTRTSIHFSIKSGVQPSHYTIKNDPYPAINKNFEKEKPFIASQITSICHRISTAARMRSSYPAVMGMQLLPPRLLGEAQNYIACLERGDDPTFPYEGILTRLLENGEIGLAQRIETKFSPSKGALSIPAQYADGVLASIFAIENFVDFIFRSFSEVEPDKYGIWPGYVFFSDTCGFQYNEGDIFSLPLEAVTSPISDRINWLTLTHEISHTIFTILNVDAEEKEIIQESAYRVRQSSDLDLEDWEYQRVKDEYFELFANWFDYYHFYNSDMNFYQTSIWRSWDTVPFVHKEQIEYIFRSFMIFLMAEVDNYRRAITYGEEETHLEGVWGKYIAFVKLHIPDIYSKFEFEPCKNKALELVREFGGPFSHIAKKYRLENFRTYINTSYSDLGEHVSSIFHGNVIAGEIQNPFLLVRECLRTQSGCTSDISTASAALIFSLRNNVKFLLPDEE